MKQQPVFGLLDGLDLRADQLHAVLVEHAAFGQLDRKIQRRLPANGRRSKPASAARARADDLFQILARERLDVGAVGELRIRHDGRRIRIDQDHFVAVGLERLAGLRAGVVELAACPMMIGPEPTIRMLEMSLRRGIC